MLSLDDILINAIKNIRWISCQSYVITRHINLQWFYRHKFQKLSERRMTSMPCVSWATSSPSLITVCEASKWNQEWHTQASLGLNLFLYPMLSYETLMVFFSIFKHLILLLIKTWSKSYCLWPEKLLRVFPSIISGNKPSFLRELQISYQHYLKIRCCNTLHSFPRKHAVPHRFTSYLSF